MKRNLYKFMDECLETLEKKFGVMVESVEAEELGMSISLRFVFPQEAME